MRSVHFAVVLATALAPSIAPSIALAHPIVPDGRANEWLARDAPAPDSAFIVRDREEPGEFVWRDSTGDARGAIDVTQLRVHGNPDGIGVFVRFAAPPPACAMVQLAIDLDRAPSSGAVTFDRDTSTQIRADSRPEFIVVATGSGGVVRDPAGRSVATFGASVGVDGLELFVPWMALGRAGWPTGVRFTTAAYCASDGANPDVVSSDALSSRVVDAMTDYGGPSAGTRHTRDEISDGTLDKVFSLHFVTSGTIPTALALQRVAPMVDRVRGGAWFELTNRTGEALSLDGYAFGDEGVAGGPDALFAIPSGITVMPGASITIAEDGAAYRAVYGRAATVELGATDPATPDAIALSTRGRGTFSIDPAGDELVVFDAERTLLDAFTFNASSFGGTAPYPALARNVALTRNPTGLDTDDGRLDFYPAGAPCAIDDHCEDRQCSFCDRGLCSDRPDGLRCATGLCSGQCSVGRCEREPSCDPDSGDAYPATDATDATDADDVADARDASATMDSGRDDSGSATDAARDASGVTDSSDGSVRDGMDLDAIDGSRDATTSDIAADAGARPPSVGCACRSAARTDAPTKPASILWSIVVIAALRRRRARFY
ncbi:MAG: lamin tail domain-containing protein [Myxococcales bacterium]|nr:lamin tail domain-containing protein [Myxococcales bacterium]